MQTFFFYLEDVSAFYWTLSPLAIKVTEKAPQFIRRDNFWQNTVQQVPQQTEHTSIHCYFCFFFKNLGTIFSKTFTYTKHFLKFLSPFFYLNLIPEPPLIYLNVRAKTFHIFSIFLPNMCIFWQPLPSIYPTLSESFLCCLSQKKKLISS